MGNRQLVLGLPELKVDCSTGTLVARDTREANAHNHRGRQTTEDSECSGHFYFLL